MKNVVRAALHITFMVIVAGCDDSAGPEGAYLLQVASGHDQIGGAGTRLPQPVIVRLVRGGGQPVPGAVVTWRTLEGGGAVSERITTTDSDGRASTEWILGNDVGPQTLLASTRTATITIRATGAFQIASVAAGFRHTCALATSGSAYCWGTNSQGQLGNGTTASSNTPVSVVTPVRFRLLTAGWSHTCGLSSAGEAFCWGDNSVGQAGFASDAQRSATPEVSAGSDAFVALSTGFVHSCAITSNGDGVCWGSGAQGQLGGAPGNRVRISGLQLKAISAGEFHSCALRSNGAATCWGWNSAGEVGNGGGSGVTAITPVPVQGNILFSAISAGVRHTCAIATTGRAYCWGRNAVGETGQDPLVAVSIPQEVSGGVNFTAIGTGNTHTCALSGQRAYCWGSSPANGTTASTKVPSLVSSNLLFTSISIGYEHTCGIANGEVWCWGSNSHGQLGQTGVAQTAVPLRVAFPPPS